MKRYLIVSPHLVEQCDQAIQDLHASGYLHCFEWGCKDNDHTAYAILEAESLEHARQIVPWYLRDKAHIVQLVKFEVADTAHRSAT
jgi:hypothetical protein